MKKILILGGGYSHVPIIDTANNMGLYTVVMDKNPNAPGFSISKKSICLDGGDKKQVLKIAREENVNGILATGDYSVIPAAYASQKIKLPGLGIKTASLVTNKGKLFEKFRKNGVPLPNRTIVKNYNNAISESKKIGFPLILKPVYSFGASRGVIRVNNVNELKEKYQFTEKFCLKKGVILEQFIEGVEHTIESLIVNGKTKVLAISDKIRTIDPYCVAISLDYPSKQSIEIQKKIIKAAKIANNTAGIVNGASHIEAISNKNNVYVIDFGGRGGAGGFIPTAVVPHVKGINMMKNMIHIALGEKTEPLIEKHSNYVVYRFFVPNPGVVKKIIGLKKIKKFKWIVDLRIYVKKGDQIRPLSNQLLRSGHFVVIGRNQKEVNKRVRIVEDMIKIIT